MARTSGRIALALTVALVAALPGIGSAVADTTHTTVVSDDPVNNTPNVNQGAVRGLAIEGSTMVAGGNFSSVTQSNGTQFSRTNLFAFNIDTGAVIQNFNPAINGRVNQVISAGDGTVYIAGAFTTVGTSQRSRVARIDATSGAVISQFNPPNISAPVNDMVLANGKVYIAGGFKRVAGQNRIAFAALDAATGIVDTTVGFSFTDTWNGGSVNIQRFDVSSDGSRAVVIGNFRNVNAQSRPQIAVLNLATNPASLNGWSTQRFTDTCASVFDTYMRDVDIAPDGSYFVVVNTGAAGGPNSICDTATRWEMTDQPNQQPSWINHTGGDTQTAVLSTTAAVYVGGHQRWMNNPNGFDSAGPGAVPREGIAALDPRNGLPLSWNPGRARNVGVQTFVAIDETATTDAGLWVGHDSNRLGGEQRKRIAFLPLAGGTALPPENTGSLPGSAFTMGPFGSATSNVLYRVDAGGTLQLANDGGPDWMPDSGGEPSPYRNAGSNEAAWGEPFGRAPSVPASTPQAVFSTERWSPSDDPAMEWNFPALAGTPLEVRLYFANGYSGTAQPGQRVFDVSIDGSLVLDDYDIAADVGDHVGTMKDFDVTADGDGVDIDFAHVVENPLVSAIEIVRTDVPPGGGNGPDDVTRNDLDASGAVTFSTVVGDGDGGQDWSSARGAFMIDGVLYNGTSSGTLQARTYNGSTFGPASTVNLYGLAAFANDLANVTGMFYDRSSGRLYYTLAGQPRLFYRYFTPESRVVGAVRFDGPGNGAGIDWRNVSGMFLVDGTLFLGDRGDGNLRAVGWNGTAPVGALSGPLSGPAVDRVNWTARATFLYAAP